MKIIPFGKYKDQPIEILIQDSEYTNWLLNQPWFNQRFPEFKSIIINNFKEPSDTLEHNKLQVKFLNDDYCIRLLQYLKPQLFDPIAKIDDSSWSFKFGENIRRIIVKKDFEYKGIDVQLNFDIYYQQTYNDFLGSKPLGSATYQAFPLQVEIKPVIGDDYPTVLRQMKASQANILYIGTYNGSGATIEQFEDIFKNSGIRVVFEGDLD